MHLLNWSKIYWEYTKGLIRKFLCIYLQHLFSLNLNSSAPCLNGLSFICFKPQYLVRSTNLETSQKYNLTIQPLPTFFDFLTFFIDSSCFKDVAKYDCSVFIYLLYRINWWHTPLWWVVLYVSKNCGPEKKSEYPYRYWEVMILSALSTYYILGFIKKTPSRNVFAKTLLNRLSVGCSLSSNETRSDQCLVAKATGCPLLGLRKGDQFTQVQDQTSLVCLGSSHVFPKKMLRLLYNTWLHKQL